MKSIFVTGMLLASMQAFAQKMSESKVPAPVKATFNKNFATVKDAKWEKENDNYEANFQQNGTKMSATFNANGTWLETENAVDVSELPAAATTYLASNYKGEKVKGAAKLKMANGETHYEAEVKGMDVIFDETGKFLKTQKD
jgi:hypothetical protein